MRAAPWLLAEIEPDELGRPAADVEDEHGRGLVVDQRGAAGDRELGLRLAADDFQRETRPVFDAVEELRAVGGGPAGLRRDEARAARRPRRLSLSAHTCSASMVRSMATSESRPVADNPSPSRMIRENASTTWKPRREGLATSKRQLLVPRSRAA